MCVASGQIPTIWSIFIIFILDRLYKHLEKPSAHARLLFDDFSSAFNKMQSHILIEQLSFYFNLPDFIVALKLFYRQN